MQQLLVAAATLVVTSGWWVAVVELWPASARPYIGGSQTNSALELALGYNGLGRLTGDEAGSVGGGQGWGTPGLLRLFGADFGSQVAWLIPAALILSGAVLWWSRSAPRTNAQRAQVLLWLGSLLVTGLTFSLMQGIVHAYYAVALAPPIAALVGIGAAEVWRLRAHPTARVVLATSLLATVATAWVLLSRSPDWFPALRGLVLVAGLVAVVAIMALPLLGRRLVLTVAATSLVVGLAGPAAYALQTAGTGHTGSLPSAGPAVTADDTGGARRAGPGGGPGGASAGGPGGLGRAGAPDGAGGAGRTGGAGGGLLDSSSPSAALSELLSEDASRYTWVAASVGAQSAAGYQLATREPVLAIGGFNGTDPSPTLEQFQKWVADGEVHWFIASTGGGRAGGPGGDQSGTSARITTWVTSTFEATTVDGVELYDLTS